MAFHESCIVFPLTQPFVTPCIHLCHCFSRCAVLYILTFIYFVNHCIFLCNFLFFWSAQSLTACMLKPTRTCNSLKVFAFRQHFRGRPVRKNSFEYYCFGPWWNTVKTWHGWKGNIFAMYKKPKRKTVQPFFIVHYKCQ